MTHAGKARTLDPLGFAQEPTRLWFAESFKAPTPAQCRGWPEIARGASTLLLAPTGSGKTLTAFLAALDRLLFAPLPRPKERCRVLYVSPLKALGVDVERNLRRPLTGISQTAERLNQPVSPLVVGVRSGDTPASERARFLRHPPDILITTPESLFLLLTARAAANLAFVDTVIVDEIHALAGSKRGAHLFVSLERLEQIRKLHGRAGALQRIGLSATQRPLEEISRLLGGGVAQEPGGAIKPRPVSVVDAGIRRALDIRLEAPLPPGVAQPAGPKRPGATRPEPHAGETGLPSAPLGARPAAGSTAGSADGSGVGPAVAPADGGSAQPMLENASVGAFSETSGLPSVWPAIHLRLLELIRTHTSTLIFVNARRMAERLAQALNELAETSKPTLNGAGQTHEYADRKAHQRVHEWGNEEDADEGHEGDLDEGREEDRRQDRTEDHRRDARVDPVGQMRHPTAFRPDDPHVGPEIALAHHGSLAKEARANIEARLKAGTVPALVATSSLELGIDMGAIDLVVQIEAPPSVAAGLQRVGRAGHSVDAVSRGVIFPKYRADLLAGAAAVAAMKEGAVEPTFYPRNPLDVLAQQMVAAVAMNPFRATDLFDLMRRAAPFFELSRAAFEGVLDMLSGRYPSADFAELKPRLNWDRISGRVEARRGAQRLAVTSGGTIPDRGLYGVFLQPHEGGRSTRVGELDEEMVYESQAGDVFLLGASSWRITEITHDRVMVVPAPGEPGRMPFWRGDRPARPLAFGREIGALARRLAGHLGELSSAGKPETGAARTAAQKHLRQNHGLDDQACTDLVDYICEQRAATGAVPSDQTVVVERFKDEVGDWRVAVLSPFGGQVHAPWCTAVVARVQAALGLEVDSMWADDGMVFRFPQSDTPPDAALFIPEPEQVQELVTAHLSNTALFAAQFRENAARALLLPRRMPGKRTPLWVQRRRASDLLEAASRYGDFPLVLETYRECLRDIFDMPGLRSLCEDMAHGRVQVVVAETQVASPFASTLLFAYVGNFLYEGDAPLAERRAQALALDQQQLRDLLGEINWPALLEPDVAQAVALSLARLGEAWRISDADSLADTLRVLGDLSISQLLERAAEAFKAELHVGLERLVKSHRVVCFELAGELRWIAAEDAGRYRDALGAKVPANIPAAFAAASADPLGELIMRYARTHVPFTASELAQRWGLGVQVVSDQLQRLVGNSRLLAGVFLPPDLKAAEARKTEEEHSSEAAQKVAPTGALQYCEPEVLTRLKRQSLARLRAQVKPANAAAVGRFLPRWQGLESKAQGLDAVLDVVQMLQGYPLLVSVMEPHIFAPRVQSFAPRALDELCSAGEIVWRGLAPRGQNDGRVALYLTDDYHHLAPAVQRVAGSRATRVRALLRQRGALFFDDMAAELQFFRPELLQLLWQMVWAGEITNDTLAPLRGLGETEGARSGRGLPRRSRSGGGYRSRRRALRGAEGRWSLLPTPAAGAIEPSGSTPREEPFTDGTLRHSADPGVQPAPHESAVSATSSGALLQPSPPRQSQTASHTQTQFARAQQLLRRHGVVTRESLSQELMPGGFSALYPLFKALEDSARARRGYFIEGQGAAQFAVPGADNQLRAKPHAVVHVLAATDPANPYGGVLPWPPLEPQAAAQAHIQSEPQCDRQSQATPLSQPPTSDRLQTHQAAAPDTARKAETVAPASDTQSGDSIERFGRKLQRVPGAFVVLVDGYLCAYFGRPDDTLFRIHLPAQVSGQGLQGMAPRRDLEPQGDQGAQHDQSATQASQAPHNIAEQVAEALVAFARARLRTPLFLAHIDAAPAAASPWAPAFIAAGFRRTGDALMVTGGIV